MYYYGGREAADREPGQCRPIVYHYRQQFEPTWSMEYVVNYLGDPLPDLETATRAAYDWANSRGLFPLELE